MDDLLADFLTETNESLAELDTALVKLERTPNDTETLALIFRLVHTIKGTCGFLGLPRLEHVAHAAENVLGRVRDGQLVVNPGIITTVLAAIDRIKEIVEGLATNATEPAGDDTALVAALNAAAEGTASEAPAAPPAQVDVVQAQPAAIAPMPDAPVATTPVATAPVVAQVEPAVPTPVAAELPGEAPVEGSMAGPQTIRVGVDVLEDLMTLVSELVLTRNQLLQLARVHEAQNNDASGFTVPLQRLSHITSDLQEGVMKTRMQPIGNAWQKLPRLVRDLARDVGKKIELVMRGAETELDRQVLELIKDPLTHMVRNSGDHGLESAAQRRAAGKPETGRILLNAYHEGGHIIIEVADDGTGLHVDRIRNKVLSKGLATEAELAGMGDAEIQRFIFRPGFSTAAQVTAVSGRGVGMDVVKTNIEKIGGTIDLKSEPGRGTTFTIKIPLTLAIVSALIVEAGGERFAIPQISVVELVRARLDSDTQDTTTPMVEHIHGTPVLRLRDRLLPLVNLTDLLALRTARESQSERSAHVVVVQVGVASLGIVVDRVFDTEEIVVKPVAPILRHITMFSGNTILGDGSVIMILDPNGIARATGVAGTAGTERRTDRTPDGALPAARTQDKTAMLLFRAGGAEPKAVPLNLVARLEDLPREKIEMSAGQPVTQYRGRLMPLVPLTGTIDPAAERFAVLVFTDGDGRQERCMGLLVDEIVDVVEDNLNIELSGDRPGLLGSAVIAGRATDVIDIGHWLTQASQDWFRRSDTSAGGDSRPHVLVVEDSDFFRQLLVPTLGAAGYRVTAASDATEALRLRDAGVMFDAVVSDIEMPRIDGHALVRQIRAGGPWAHLPVIALTSHASPDHIDAGREAGFTDYVAKFEREALLASLRQCLAATGRSAIIASARRLEDAA
jgi:two-component system chemotaxis sensor kinase CheA